VCSPQARECIRLGYHPTAWKSARGIVIPKPGKPDYGRVRAYRVISLLYSLGKLVERTAAHLLANHLETKRLLHEGQYGSRVRHSTVDAVAVLMSRTREAWKKQAVAGALLMGIMSAFNNVSRVIFARLGVDPDQLLHARQAYTARMEGRTGAEHSIESGIPQGSPVSPVLFEIYISEMFGYVEERADDKAPCGTKG